jgi:hypothetical protein
MVSDSLPDKSACELPESEQSLEDINIHYERVRTFFEFETTTLLTVTEELILLNKGVCTSFFPYELDDYRTALRILDSDGANLVFHSFEQYRFKPGYENFICIEFPKEKPLGKNEYRLVKLQYIKSIPKKPNTIPFMKEAEINVTLYKDTSMYSYIKECEGYEFFIHYYLFDKYRNKLDSSPIKTNKQCSFCEMSYNAKEELEGEIRIIVTHKIPKQLLRWYKLGQYFGTTAILFMGLSYLWDKLYSSNTGLNINSYFVLASLTVSFLIVLKGWVFQKKMDKELMKFDRRYRTIISIIIIEIVTIIFYDIGLLSSFILYIYGLF